METEKRTGAPIGVRVFVCVLAATIGVGCGPGASEGELAVVVSRATCPLCPPEPPDQGPALNSENHEPDLWVAGHSFQGATLDALPLVNVRVEAGELVAELNGALLRGAQLTGASFAARVMERTGAEPIVSWREHRITEVRPELAEWDRFPLGQTFLYAVERQVPESGEWRSICGTDANGLSLAVPVEGVWDERGDRADSSDEFTFACTAGAIGKCYRWGYRPWTPHPDGPEAMKAVHQSCTRMARADYCGDGTAHTYAGTQISFWDTVPAPGPFRTRQAFPGMAFEAGWAPHGAVCLSRARWLEVSEEVRIRCPDRLIPPGTVNGNATVCDDHPQAQNFGTPVSLFNQSYLSVAE